MSLTVNDLPEHVRGVAAIAIEAMKSGRCLDISYHQEDRIVEVHAVGVSLKGNPCARVYQVVGGSVFSQTYGWKLISLDAIETATMMVNFPFHGPRPGYKPHDHSMREIIEEISDEPVPNPEP